MPSGKCRTHQSHHIYHFSNFPAFPTSTRDRIRGSLLGGALFMDADTRGHLESCDISDNEGANVDIFEGADPLLTSCKCGEREAEIGTAFLVVACYAPPPPHPSPLNASACILAEIVPALSI